MQYATTLLSRNQFAETFCAPVREERFILAILLNQTIYHQELAVNVFLLIRQHKRRQDIHGNTCRLLFLVGTKNKHVFRKVISKRQCSGASIDANVPADKSYWAIVIVLCYCIFILLQIIERRATEIVLAVAWNRARLRLCCLYGVNQFLIGGVEGLHLTLESLFVIVASHARHLAAGHVTAVLHQPVGVSGGTHQEEALSQVLQYLSRNIGLVKLLRG